jgi:hypothetical protein
MEYIHRTGQKGPAARADAGIKTDKMCREALGKDRASASRSRERAFSSRATGISLYAICLSRRRAGPFRSGKSSSAGGVKALMHVNGGRRSIRSFTYVLFRKGQTEYRASHALGIVRTSEGMEASDV